MQSNFELKSQGSILPLLVRLSGYIFHLWTVKLNLYARESATPKLHKSLQTSVREEMERKMMGGRGEAGLRALEREREALV